MRLVLIFLYENDERGNLINKQLTCIFKDENEALKEFNKLDVNFKKRYPKDNRYYALEYWITVD